MTPSIHYCSKCKNTLLKNEFIQCSICNMKYDLDCANVSEKRYRLMTKENKINWKCSECINKHSKAHILNNPTHSLQTTDFSYIENVTFRRPLQRSLSELNLSNSHNLSLLSSTSIDSLQHNCTIQSLPAISNFNTSLLEDLKQQLESCKIELESAHEEVAKLMQENNQYIQTIEEQNKQISTLKKLSSEITSQYNSPMNKNTSVSTPLSRKLLDINIRTPRISPLNKKLTDMKIRTSRLSPLHNERCVCRINTLNQFNNTTKTQQDTQNNQKTNTNENLASVTVSKLSQTKKTTTTSGNTRTSLGTQTSSPLSTDVTPSTKKMNRNIIIIGDELVRGLGRQMKHISEDKYDNSYSITSIIKPYANCTQILSSCNDICNSTNKEDIVILGIGSHDKNPYKILSELSVSLAKLNKTNVFVLKVQSNSFLNEQLLNQKIKLVIKNYPNCKFIESLYYKRNVNYYLNYSKDFIYSLGYNLCTEIDNLNYKKQTIDGRRSIININHIKKGTIPYYFAKIATNNSIKNRVINQSSSNLEFFRSYSEC